MEVVADRRDHGPIRVDNVQHGAEGVKCQLASSSSPSVGNGLLDTRGGGVDAIVKIKLDESVSYAG